MGQLMLMLTTLQGVRWNKAIYSLSTSYSACGVTHVIEAYIHGVAAFVCCTALDTAGFPATILFVSDTFASGFFTDAGGNP